MITTKEELRLYLKAECSVGMRTRIRQYFLSLISYDYKEIVDIRRFLRFYRKYEYYYNKGPKHSILEIVYKIKYDRYSRRLNILIPINRVGLGLKLFHTYQSKSIIGGEIGRNVIIRPGLILANQGYWRKVDSCPIVEDFVEFSFGVKAFGPIRIGRGSLIQANTVLLCNVPPYSIVAGNPGKIVGFVKTPSQIIEFEKQEYPEKDRMSQNEIERNYQIYFLDRLAEIQKIISIG